MRPLYDRTRTDPATSYWLRNAIEANEHRDPVDALNDAETLVRILKERAPQALEAEIP